MQKLKEALENGLITPCIEAKVYRENFDVLITQPLSDYIDVKTVLPIDRNLNGQLILNAPTSLHKSRQERHLTIGTITELEQSDMNYENKQLIASLLFPR